MIFDCSRLNFQLKITLPKFLCEDISKHMWNMFGVHDPKRNLNYRECFSYEIIWSHKTTLAMRKSRNWPVEHSEEVYSLSEQYPRSQHQSFQLSHQTYIKINSHKKLLVFNISKNHHGNKVTTNLKKCECEKGMASLLVCSLVVLEATSLESRYTATMCINISLSLTTLSVQF